MRTFGNSGLVITNTCGCLGFNFTGSGTISGLGSGGRGRTLGLTFGGGGGVAGWTGICVIGIINSTTSNFRAVCMDCGKIMGDRRRRPKIANCAPALTPRRFHWGLRSGRSSKRAETFFVAGALVLLVGLVVLTVPTVVVLWTELAKLTGLVLLTGLTVLTGLTGLLFLTGLTA